MPRLPPADATNLGILIISTISLILEIIFSPLTKWKERDLNSTRCWLKGILEDAPGFYEEKWKWPEPKEVASDKKERRKFIPDEEVGQEAPCKEETPNVAKGEQKTTSEAKKTLNPNRQEQEPRNDKQKAPATHGESSQQGEDFKSSRTLVVRRYQHLIKQYDFSTFFPWMSHAQRSQRAIRDVERAEHTLRRSKFSWFGLTSEVRDAVALADSSVAALTSVSDRI